MAGDTQKNYSRCFTISHKHDPELVEFVLKEIISLKYFSLKIHIYDRKLFL